MSFIIKSRHHGPFRMPRCQDTTRERTGSSGGERERVRARGGEISSKRERERERERVQERDRKRERERERRGVRRPPSALSPAPYFTFRPFPFLQPRATAVRWREADYQASFGCGGVCSGSKSVSANSSHRRMKVNFACSCSADSNCGWVGYILRDRENHVAFSCTPMSPSHFGRG